MNITLMERERQEHRELLARVDARIDADQGAEYLRRCAEEERVGTLESRINWQIARNRAVIEANKRDVTP